jgi:hypothetical protein
MNTRRITIIFTALILLLGIAAPVLAVTGQGIYSWLLGGSSNQGKTCADLDGTYADSGTTWVEFKLEGGSLTNGLHTDGIIKVTLSNLGTTGFDWSSDLGVDAIVVKDGVDGANFYVYDGLTSPADNTVGPSGSTSRDSEGTSDTNLTTPNAAKAISHISFCYDAEEVKYGSLQVTKTVNWNGFPADPDQTFEICISGPSYPAGDCQTVGSSGGTLTWNNLAPGSYTVTETDPGTLWTTTVISSPVTVEGGSTAQVSVNNTHAAYIPLLLTSMCSDDPTVTRRWRVRNSNPYDVEFTYLVYGTSQTGTYVAPANSDFFFETTTVPGPNTTIIYVNGAQQSVKGSGGAWCTGHLEVTKTVNWNGFPVDTSQTFEICVTGPKYPTGTEEGACQTADYEGGVLTWSNLYVGEYTVKEADPGAAWTVEVIGSPATVLKDQTAQASVTNTHEKPTAIELASFTAEANGGAVTLAWETAAEIDNAGFNLYRAIAPDGPYAQINDTLIAAQGSPASGVAYSLVDQGLAPGTYYYTLEDVDYSGATALHGPISATVAPALRRPAHRPMLPALD